MDYRIVYCSRNRIEGDPAEMAAEIDRILEVSRRNNEARDITGALIFNGVAFAQVLEGPKDSVEKVYARIRHDLRHSDVLTLEQAYQPERHFAGWTMAYADANTLRDPSGAEIDLTALQANPAGFAGQILRLLRNVLTARLASETELHDALPDRTAADCSCQAGSAIS
jgi:hypothetical protein